MTPFTHRPRVAPGSGHPLTRPGGGALAGGKGAGTAVRGRPRQPVSGPRESPLPNSQTTTRLPPYAMYTVKCCPRARDSEIYFRMTGGPARRGRQRHLGANSTCTERASAHCEPSLPRRRERTKPSLQETTWTTVFSVLPRQTKGWFHRTGTGGKLTH